MSEWLDKKSTLFERDEEGKLLPQTVTLELLEGEPKIKALPVPRGKLQRIHKETTGGDTTKDQDKTIILEHCLEPKYTEEELAHMKPTVANAIALAILALSLDMSQKDLQKTSVEKAVEMSEEYLKKK